MRPLPLSFGSGQVKRAVVQVISAMAHHGYLEQPGGEAMIEYIVQQCALSPETEVRGHHLTHLFWGPGAVGLLGPHFPTFVGGCGYQQLPGPSWRAARWVKAWAWVCVLSSFL